MPKAREAILLVDDDPDVLLSLGRLIRRTMPHVDLFTAGNARDALALIEGGQHVDVVVSDFRMPDVDGIELLEKIHKIAPQVLTLMLTAYPSPKVARDAVRRGGVILLVTKPFDPQAFVDVIKAIVAGHP